MSCRVAEQSSTMTTLCRRRVGGAIFLVAVRFWTRPFTSGHSLWSPPRGFNSSVFAVRGLQFYGDGRKIAPYANTLPGSFFLLEDVV
jgi:hypothetical protein